MGLPPETAYVINRASAKALTTHPTVGLFLNSLEYPDKDPDFFRAK